MSCEKSNKRESSNSENTNINNSNNFGNSNNTPVSNSTTNNNEKENLGSTSQIQNSPDDNLELPSYEEVLNFQLYSEENSENLSPRSSQYAPNKNQYDSFVDHQSSQIYPAQQIPQSQPLQQKAPGTQQQQDSPYLLNNTSNNTSFLQIQPSKSITSTTSTSSFLIGQPVSTSSNTSQPINPLNSANNDSTTQSSKPVETNNISYQIKPGQPVPQNSYFQVQQGQPVTQGIYSYVVSPTPINASANIYPTAPTVSQCNDKETFSQSIPSSKHTFNCNKPESASNQNFETCYDGEYQDMNDTITISTGTFGTRKIQVKALARVNMVKSTIGNNIIDIRGARLLNGESQIIFDGTLGRLILVVPKYLSLIIEDQYCIGEVLSHRPTEVPVNEAKKKGLPIVRVMVKNTLGDVNIIEKGVNISVSTESLNLEIKKLRKEYIKNNKKLGKKKTKNNNMENSNGNNYGTSLISMKAMFKKTFNSAKQQINNQVNKPVNLTPYHPAAQSTSYSYTTTAPYGVPTQSSSTCSTSVYPYSSQLNYSYSYQGYPLQATQGDYPLTFQQVTTTAPYSSLPSAPISTTSLSSTGSISVGHASSQNYITNPLIVSTAPPSSVIVTSSIGSQPNGNVNINASPSYSIVHPCINTSNSISATAPPIIFSSASETPTTNAKVPYPPRA
ncbi:hypothetical protein U3516DRAFT_579220 [Neocallimastix sp. 'constans']|jgi:hypothetical protein